MNRTLLRSTAFVRAAKRLLKKHPEAAPILRDVFVTLAEDAFHPLLKTHKLKGEFSGLWACSVGYDLRVVFEFIQHDGAEVIQLHTIGTHDEVY